MKLLEKSKRAMWIIAFAMVCGSAGCLNLQPKSIENDDETLSPYFVVLSDHPDTDLLPLKETSVRTDIVGAIADVRVKQVYVNSGQHTLEAIYTFPMSTQAAVYGMKMTIGNRTIFAQIEEKQKAREEYEKAKEEGKRASLLEQSRPNVFTMNVSNIMAGDTITVELSYTELLVPERGRYSFVYPTVVGPRYSNKNAEDHHPDDDFVASPYTKSGEKPSYALRYELVIRSGVPVQDVTCKTHKMNITHPDLNTSVVQLDASEASAGNRDVIVDYSLQGDRIESGMMLYEGRDENFFLMMVQPPKQVLKKDIPPREYIFIVDVSGSMYGFPLDVAKRLMRNLIVNLRADDKFNVVLFSGAAAVMNPTSVDATQANIERAVRYIDEQHGSGATEVLGALRMAYAIPRPDADISRTFVIVTDGFVDVEKEAFEMIRRNSDHTNVFCFGIGRSVNRYLIEGMAFAGHGEPMIVTEESEATQQAGQFRRYINTPVLTRIKLNTGAFQAYDIEPIASPDMLAERPILIFGKYKGKAQGKVTLTGKAGRQTYKQTFDVSTLTPNTAHAALRYLWARERIKYLDYLVDENGGKEDPNIKKITKLGLKYDLMTNYTSFLAIDEKVVEQNGKKVTVRQPLPLPQGVSDYAVGESAMFMKQSMSLESADAMYAEEDIAVLEESLEPTVLETRPEFPGGTPAMNHYIYKHLQYPEEAAKNQIQGRVIVSFTVRADGTIADIEVIRGIHELLNAEAVRVIRSMPKWKPGTRNGKPVAMEVVIPVVFRPI